MEIKINIDLEDVVNDAVPDKESLAENIKKHIISLVANDIVYKCRKDCEIMLKSMVQEQMQSIITESFNKWKDGANVRYDGDLLTPDEYINKIMTNSSASMYNSTVKRYIEDFAKIFACELKKRYDMSFAAMIVHNMAEQKLLRDDKLEELVKQ